MKSDNVMTRAGNHYGEKIISTFSGDIKEELRRLMMGHMEGKQWQGLAQEIQQHPISRFSATLWDNGCGGGRDKGTCERKKKKSFLGFIYDARKVSWTHQNMQQWSYCQGRWSVFIVDWANEWGKKEGERKWEREGGERGGQLYCIRVLTISSLPHHHSPQNGYFVPSCSHGGGVGWGWS